MMVTKVLAEGKRLRLAMASQEGVTVRWGLKEAGVQSYEPSLPRTRSGEQEPHKTGHPGVSQHKMTKPCGSGDTVNDVFVQRKFTLLNRVPFGKFNRVNVLIRGGLSIMWGVSLFSEMFG